MACSIAATRCLSASKSVPTPEGDVAAVIGRVSGGVGPAAGGEEDAVIGVVSGTD